MSQDQLQVVPQHLNIRLDEKRVIPHFGPPAQLPMSPMQVTKIRHEFSLKDVKKVLKLRTEFLYTDCIEHEYQLLCVYKTQDAHNSSALYNIETPSGLQCLLLCQ